MIFYKEEVLEAIKDIKETLVRWDSQAASSSIEEQHILAARYHIGAAEELINKLPFGGYSE